MAEEKAEDWPADESNAANRWALYSE